MTALAVALVSAVLVLVAATAGARFERARAKREREQGNVAHAIQLEGIADKLDQVSAVGAAAIRVMQRHEQGEDLIQALLGEVEGDHGQAFVEHVVAKGTPTPSSGGTRVS